MPSEEEYRERFNAPIAFVTKDVEAVADALALEAEEHGVPNSFSPGELAQHNRVPSVLAVGKIGRWFPVALNACLHGYGLSATYEGRRFHITQRD